MSWRTFRLCAIFAVFLGFCPAGNGQEQPAGPPSAPQQGPDSLREIIRQGEEERSQGKLPAALATFQTARRVAENSGDKPGLSEALLNIGIIQDIQGNDREALDSLDASLKLAQASCDKRLTARGLVNRGNVYTQTGQLPEALSDYRASLEIAESLHEKAWIARLHQNIGNANAQLGNTDEAMADFQQALATLGDDKTETRSIAASLERIGYLYLRQGNNAQALEYFQRSYATLGPSGDKELSRHLLNDFGQVHEAQGDFVHALNYYKRSMVLSKQIGDERGQATAFENIGIAEEVQGAHEAAAGDFQKSLAIFEKTDTKDGVLAVLGNLGEVEYSKGNFEKALDYEKKSQALAESLGDQESLAAAGGYTALIYIKQHKFDEALVHAKGAAEIAERIGSQDVLAQTQAISGMAYSGLGQSEQARQSFLAAISIVEGLRNQVAGGEEQQQAFFSMRLDPYYGMVELLTAQNQPAEALRYAELAKGRALLDILRNGKVQITKAMTSAEREREQQLLTEMTALNKQVAQENDAEKPDLRRVADLQTKVEAARLRYADFQTNLFAAHPELKAQRGQAQPLSLQEAAQLLPDTKSAFLEFVTGEEKTYLFVLTRKKGPTEAPPELNVHVIPVTRKELERRAERFPEQLSRRDLAFRPTARGLFQTLIEPARKQLAGRTALVIVPDGPLWNLPFQALLGDNGHYLLDDYAVAYAPSLTVLREMMRVHQKSLTATSQSSTLFAMADPVLRRDTVQRAAIEYRGETLGPLPEARQEAVKLRQLYGAKQSKVYTGPQAGEDRFKSEAGKFRVLHLATHGVFNDANPMYSHVLLSPGKPDSKEDGLLEAWEIMQMDLHADLAVLSACETARGHISAGEGVIGLSWAFFVAGVPTTVVSQWKVESASTANLMLAFHRALRTANSTNPSAFGAARALQRAELQLLHDPKYAHPFYWAGFVLVGDPR